jgi:hypothetical protein
LDPKDEGPIPSTTNDEVAEPTAAHHPDKRLDRSGNQLANNVRVFCKDILD